jgi:hypothetical protein
MNNLEIITTHRWGALCTVDREIVDYDNYVQNCAEQIYEDAGGKNITPESLCETLFQNIVHSGGSTQIVAVVLESDGRE